MPVRTIDTRVSRMLEHGRDVSARPGRPPKGPPAPPDEDERTSRRIGTAGIRAPRTPARSFRRPASIVAAVLLGVVLFAPGARAHVGESFSHVWKQHIKPRLATPGTLNATGNPVDWTRLKGVPGELADGMDRGVDQVAGAIGGGANPSGATQFFGEPAVVTVTSSSQQILVASSSAFGTSGAPASALNLFICRRQLPSGTVTTVGNGIAGNQLPANTKVTMGMSRVLQLDPGQYEVGLCGTGGAGWNNNDWGTTTALVIDV